MLTFIALLKFILMPMPITTVVGPSISPCVSISTPASFSLPATISFGHFNLTQSGSRSPLACNARRIARPTTSDSPANSAALLSTRHNNENVSDAPSAECHTRPRRPRPAVCNSATTQRPLGAPSVARRVNSALVESMLACTSTSTRFAVAPSAARINSTSSSSSGAARR